MKKEIIIMVIAVMIMIVYPKNTFSQKNTSPGPMSLKSWTLTFAVGPATHYWGNGAGFGPATKIIFETGMWKLGPGVLSLGGEGTMSFFGHTYYEGYKESWANFIFGVRSAYHYGWGVKGLDTYGGVPLGMGFSVYNQGDHPGYTGYHGVYPYFGFFFGTSYFFNRTIGVNGEFGYSSTYANLGLILKLK